MRHHLINGEEVPFTPEEETAQDIIDAEFAAGALPRAIAVKQIEIDALRDIKKSLPILSQTYQVDTGDLDVGTMATKIHASSLIGTAILSITNSGGVATATTAKNHHLKTGVTITISGADQVEYNVTALVTKTGNKAFTYPIAGTPASATGTIIFATDTMRFIPTDNSVTFVDSATYREIYLDVESYVDACQINARELKNQVLAAVDVAEVEAIDISIGWPDTGI
ncbi:MAG: hypothetical protein KAI73_12185 [Rhodospirillaceae bacterium]|nr:hypothetical protein [Rhodospirillaceae bacterium]